MDIKKILEGAKEAMKKVGDIASPAPVRKEDVSKNRKAAYDFVKEQGKKPKENEKK